MNWMKIGARIPGVHLQPAEVNASPGALLLDGQARLIGVWVLEIGPGHIERINSIVNPDKISHLGPTADFNSLLRTPSPRD